ncbi:hypothetical protein RND81_06G203700 [Saponaria officinalis]|uniref:F-box domain-containing protein n=1 Tax=Saponaria officinalis TaxID=3572 RepID=A0AAW1KC02_SAPOF
MSDLPMAVKRKTTTIVEAKDRLSSLPDDILIAILSHLPLPYAIVTGVLSTRWRGLWTNLKSTSVNLEDHTFENIPKFLTVLNNIIVQLKSPKIEVFSVDLGHLIWHSHWKPLMDSWFDQLGECNIREFKVIWPFLTPLKSHKLPKFIFQTQSLVSLELNSTFDWRLPDQFDDLNLKNLSITFCVTRSNEWVKKLIRACPLLEKLSLTSDWGHSKYIECSNQNLRRLIINIGLRRNDLKIVISCPNINYLAVRAPNCVTFSFDEDPIMLREAKIEILRQHYAITRADDDENRLLSQLCGTISNVVILGLDVFALRNTSTVFRYATRLTVDMKTSNDIQTVFNFLDFCPSLDVLTLRFCHTGRVYNKWILPKPDKANTLRGVLKRINIEIYGDTYCEPVNFVELIEYLLSSVVDLAHFTYNLANCEGRDTENVKLKQRREFKLCRLLYRCQVASTACEAEFIGRYVKMSRKAGSTVPIAYGKFIPDH